MDKNYCYNSILQFLENTLRPLKREFEKGGIKEVGICVSLGFLKM